MHSLTLKKLIFFLFLKAVLISAFILFSNVALSPDEAQYWTWSQHLDFGYYSKPPLIAWQIFLTTTIFGNTEFGVRFGAILLSTLLAFSIYKLGRNIRLSERCASWAALIFAYSPLGCYLSFAATTDCGMILGIVLAISVLTVGLRDKTCPNYPLMGFWICLGSLYKWTAFAFYPFLFAFLIFCPWLRSRALFYGLIISLCAFLPTLYWNINHDFATFKHVFYTVYHKGKASKGGNFFPFLGAQIALFSPLYFFFFLKALLQKKKSLPLLFLSVFSSGWFIYLILSLFKRMQPNWDIYFYPPAMLLIAWYTLEKMKRGQLWLYLGTCFSILFSLFIFLSPFLPIPYKYNPFRQSLGWQELEKGLEKAGYQIGKDFLFSDTYQMTSLLSFYGPEKKRAYFFNLQGNRKNQFSYWPSLAYRKGERGYFVIAQNAPEEQLQWHQKHYLEKLKPFCEKVTFRGIFPLFEHKGISVKNALIFQCDGYNGQIPLDPNKY